MKRTFLARKPHHYKRCVRNTVEKLLELNFIQRKLPRKFANKNIKCTCSPTPILHLALVLKSQAECFSYTHKRWVAVAQNAGQTNEERGRKEGRERESGREGKCQVVKNG